MRGDKAKGDREIQQQYEIIKKAIPDRNRLFNVNS